ncbi:3-oxoacyl-ACP reductase family protein [uncultured Chitinophaga sp.]|jgi:Dehydrogenases with different specificities (related to short-chain alcohol dehydrogenases)|uniref:SDR family NAD(P)-dependent oxidoreductase n=1 Tax=uncultured Chitinophaga sp. TaxID=339340 RepID=UPI0026338C63|nr:3-oxoacyl-ACP reductase family protein [uncultured Chitinophaga sp.]
MKRLTNKVALVTGGSRGIGAAIVKRLAEEGANVAFTYVSAAEKAQAVVKEVEALGVKGLAIAADNEKPEAVIAAVDKTAATFGRIDILVNSAGIWIAKPFEEHVLEDFDRLVAVNVRAVYVASQAVLRHMPEGGRIVTIGSNLAERVFAPGMTLYSMTKSALIGFTKGLARDLGSKKITVNLVQPGATTTDMNPVDGPHSDFVRSFMAIPEYGEPAGIAAVVALLASEEGRSFTGTEVTVDGGLNA